MTEATIWNFLGMDPEWEETLGFFAGLAGFRVIWYDEHTVELLGDAGDRIVYTRTGMLMITMGEVICGQQ